MLLLIGRRVHSCRLTCPTCPHTLPLMPLTPMGVFLFFSLSFTVQVLDAMDAAAKVDKPPLLDMFTDVYAGPLPPHLQQQYEEVQELVKQHPELKPPDMPLV